MASPCFWYACWSRYFWWKSQRVDRSKFGLPGGKTTVRIVKITESEALFPDWFHLELFRASEWNFHCQHRTIGLPVFMPESRTLPNTSWSILKKHPGDEENYLHGSLDAGDAMAIRYTTRYNKICCERCGWHFDNEADLEIHRCTWTYVKCHVGSAIQAGTAKLNPSASLWEEDDVRMPQLGGFKQFFLDTDVSVKNVNSYSDQGGWSTWWAPWWVDTLLPRWM